MNSTVALSTRSLPDGVSNNAGWSGLETERVCELQITGQGDSVELARVRLLVMLDEVVRIAFVADQSMLSYITLFTERPSRRVL